MAPIEQRELPGVVPVDGIRTGDGGKVAAHIRRERARPGGISCGVGPKSGGTEIRCGGVARDTATTIAMRARHRGNARDCQRRIDKRESMTTNEHFDRAVELTEAIGTTTNPFDANRAHMLLEFLSALRAHISELEGKSKSGSPADPVYSEEAAANQECECCGAPATKEDVEGVPLCDECYEDLKIETNALAAPVPTHPNPGAETEATKGLPAAPEQGRLLSAELIRSWPRACRKCGRGAAISKYGRFAPPCDCEYARAESTMPICPTNPEDEGDEGLPK